MMIAMGWRRRAGGLRSRTGLGGWRRGTTGAEGGPSGNGPVGAPRRRSWTWLGVVGAAVALVGSGALLLSRDEEQPPPPTSIGEIHVVMENGEKGIWPGGIARLADGSYYVVYERMVPTAQAFGRAMADLFADAGHEEHLAGGADSPEGRGAFDPGAATLPNGNVLVSWSNTAIGTYLLERQPDGSTSPGTQLAPTGYSEATLGNVGDHVLMTYNHIPRGDPFGAHYDNDVLVQRLQSSTEWADPVVAGGPAGSGTDGNQFRANTEVTGNPAELITVWNRPSDPPGGDRTIWGAISEDDGLSWGAPFPVAASEGNDLVNPFAILVPATGELRVYFVNRHGGGGSSLGIAVSADQGRTWGEAEDAPTPAGTRGSPGRPVFVVDDRGRVICLGSWRIDGTYVLGTFVAE
jgi:hypothetical protein